MPEKKDGRKATADYECSTCRYSAPLPIYCTALTEDRKCPGHSDPERGLKKVRALRWMEDARTPGAPDPLPLDWSEPDIDASVAIANYVTNRCAISDEGCWEWQGSLSAKGYGRIRIDGKLRLPHRLVAHAYGILRCLDVSAEDQYILHKCDNPKCCNPDHLRTGTLKDNMRDCASKGRVGGQRTLD